MPRIELDLAPAADSVAEARDRIEDALRGTVRNGVLEDVRLLISELVTNSVRHARPGGRDRVVVRVTADTRRVLVEVLDPGPGFERPTSGPSLASASGWGLYLVERLADRWGIDRSNGHTRVWFELER